MSTRYPQTMDAFREINGVGDVKLKKYGHLFLEKIADYCKTNESKTYSVPDIRKECPSAYEKWTKAQEQKLISEYKSGKTISELANLLGRQTGGIRSRLNKLNIIP